MVEEKPWAIMTGLIVVNDHWPQVDFQTLWWYIFLLFDFFKFSPSVTCPENSSKAVTFVIYAKTNLTEQLNQRPV